mmetsp:Transcript_3838/g.7236  ORF Transcript_3838/g.7236 Transcript_3838/m.7236 type:complete len:292 (-) Transcript_3838:651-1526(-)
MIERWRFLGYHGCFSRSIHTSLLLCPMLYTASNCANDIFPSDSSGATSPSLFSISRSAASCFLTTLGVVASSNRITATTLSGRIFSSTSVCVSAAFSTGSGKEGPGPPGVWNATVHAMDFSSSSPSGTVMTAGAYAVAPAKCAGRGQVGRWASARPSVSRTHRGSGLRAGRTPDPGVRRRRPPRPRRDTFLPRTPPPGAAGGRAPPARPRRPRPLPATAVPESRARRRLWEPCRIAPLRRASRAPRYWRSPSSPSAPRPRRGDRPPQGWGRGCTRSPPRTLRWASTAAPSR